MSTTTQRVPRPLSRLDLELAARRHDFAVMVRWQRLDGAVCCQIFTNLVAAERKVRRTHERGLSASLTLVRLTAVPTVLDDETPGGGHDE